MPAKDYFVANEFRNRFNRGSQTDQQHLDFHRQSLGRCVTTSLAQRSALFAFHREFFGDPSLRERRPLLERCLAFGYAFTRTKSGSISVPTVEGRTDPRTFFQVVEPP